MPSVNQHLAAALASLFFSASVAQMLGAEFCLLCLSRGVILAFKLSFDAALEESLPQETISVYYLGLFKQTIRIFTDASFFSEKKKYFSIF